MRTPGSQRDRHCVTCGVLVGRWAADDDGVSDFVLNTATTKKVGARPGVRGYECDHCRAQGRPVND